MWFLYFVLIIDFTLNSLQRQVGFDEAGRPVIYSNFAQANLRHNTSEDTICHCTYLIENAKRTMPPGVSTWVFVIDCTGKENATWSFLRGKKYMKDCNCVISHKKLPNLHLNKLSISLFLSLMKVSTFYLLSFRKFVYEIINTCIIYIVNVVLLQV